MIKVTYLVEVQDRTPQWKTYVPYENLQILGEEIGSERYRDRVYTEACEYFRHVRIVEITKRPWFRDIPEVD